jgi:hypothetical protein
MSKYISGRWMVSAFGIALGLALICSATHSAAQQIQAGANVNMVGGPASVTVDPADPSKILSIKGDPNAQRQNEVSFACSSRNPLTCVAAANDYRLINIAGTQDGKVTGDAWLGFFWTRDGGGSWRSTVVPGSPIDNSTDSRNSPVHVLEAAADATVKAAPNGVFYVSGIAFNRDATTPGSNAPPQDDASKHPDHEQKIKELKTGALFMSLYIDDNTTQNADVPPRYIRTTIIDAGTTGRFIDKPHHAFDTRGGTTCTIPGNGSIPAQTVQAGTVYAAYAIFKGDGNSEIDFTWSTDCGVSWIGPYKLSESTHVDQAANIAVDPATGNVFVVWRQFATVVNPNDDGIYISTLPFGTTGVSLVQADLSINKIKPVKVPVAFTSLPFDQQSAPSSAYPDRRMFRTNDYPALCVSNGTLNLAWSQRGFGGSQLLGTLGQEARIVFSTSANGSAWTAAKAVDNAPAGHQFMPTIACGAGKKTLLWYDQRDDIARTALDPQFFGAFIDDFPFPSLTVVPVVHTVDVRASQANATGDFSGSTRVSRYPYGFNPVTGEFIPLQANFANYPLFAGGLLPFLGDFIALAVDKEFSPPAGAGPLGWTFNTSASDQPVVHAAWADNRDILPLNDIWDSWFPPVAPGASCPPAPVTTRNQNIYTSALFSGLTLAIPGNSRPATGLFARAFPIVVGDTEAVKKTVTISLSQPIEGRASFLQGYAFTGTPPTEVPSECRTVTALCDSITADIAPFSSISRTAYVSTNSLAVVKATATQTSPPSATPIQVSGYLNPDSTNPPPVGNLSTEETHDVTISAPTSVTYSAGNFYNPTPLTPTPLTPTPLTLSYFNPTPLTLDAVNPTPLTPTPLTPTPLTPTPLTPTPLTPTPLTPTPLTTALPGGDPNATLSGTAVSTDLTWQIDNTGNVPTTYTFGTLFPNVDPTKFGYVLFVYRLFYTPAVFDGCHLGALPNVQLLASVQNPTPLTPTPLTPTPLTPTPLTADIRNVTFSLGAGETAYAVQRSIYTTGPSGSGFDSTQVAGFVYPHPADSQDVGTGNDIVPPPIVIAPVTLASTDPVNMTAAGWFNQAVPVTLIPQPASATTVTFYSVDGGSFVLGTHVLLSTEGTHTVQYYSVNNAGAVPVTESTKTLTIKIDKTPPTITLSRTPSANANGWNNTDVVASFAASDPLPPTCVLNPCVSGLNPEDTSGGYTFTLEGAGQAIKFTVTDLAGNSASATIDKVNIDKKPPTATLTRDRAADKNGWYNHLLTFSATGTDALSGLDACTAVPDYSGPDTGGTNVSTTCTDKAGNTSDPASVAFKFDATPPTAGVTADRAPDKNGWYNHLLTFTPAGSDALSGLDVCTAVPDYSGPDTGGTNVSTTCTDKAGNTSDPASVAFKFDATPPTASAGAAPPPNGNGWNKTDVTVTFTGTDGLSGIDGCQAPTVLSTEGPGQSASGTCVDKAGNVSASAAATGINIDKTPPTITYAGQAPAANLAGWNNTNVTLTWTCGDGLSGVVAATQTQTQTLTSQGNALQATGTCSDLAGNPASDTRTGIRIDKTLPAIQITSPTSGLYLLRSSVASNYACGDQAGLSGLSSCLGTVANGANIDTASVGTKTFSVNASDVAGNVAMASVGYSVQYLSAGACLGEPTHQALQPVNADGSSVFKAGSTVPVKFRVCDALGASVGTAGVVTSFNLVQINTGTLTDVNVAAASTSSDSQFRWDPAAQQWVFNLSTKDLQSNNTYTYRITLNDGTMINFKFGLK